MVKVTDTGILIDDEVKFRPHAIFECGQIFRYEMSGGNYSVISEDKRAEVCRSENGYEIRTDAPEYFYNFFDFDTDYQAIMSELEGKALMSESIPFGDGMRILRQNHFETIISFIISANNHIPRIKGIIRRLCARLGKDCGTYYAFPTVEAMAAADTSFYTEIGAGYRAEYLSSTARRIADGFDIDNVSAYSTEELARHLMQLKGVGAKVADCILLFGYSRMDTFPVDTWIKKVYGGMCNREDSACKIRKYLRDLYGNLSGYAQQYLFYAMRSGMLKI